MQSPHITQNIPLAPYTTLGVGGCAEYFCEVTTEKELRDALAWAHAHTLPITVLGGGSNVLVSDEGVKGLVLRVCFIGVTYAADADDTIVVTAGAGVSFDEFIAELVEKKIWGLENLSLIPGTVGAVPIQNVGAYGVEVAELIKEVVVYDSDAQVVKTITHAECLFGYRDSLFKKPEGKKYIVLYVTFILSYRANPKLSYKDIQEYFKGEAVRDIARIREAVCAIRTQKFPDYTVVGTAGSFFKNPIITTSAYEEACVLYPGLPGFPFGEGMVKVSLGWILDKVCNLKGYREGEIGLYEKQALVLVCTKGIAAKEIILFSEKIIEIVFQKIHIVVEREVTMLK